MGLVWWFDGIDENGIGFWDGVELEVGTRMSWFDGNDEKRIDFRMELGMGLKREWETMDFAFGFGIITQWKGWCL
jgi:hypothetical protein